MPIDPTLLDLLEDVQSGRTPEEACAGRPELLEEVRERLARIDRMNGDLHALFPGDDELKVAMASSPPTSPEIPGHVVDSVLGRGGMGVVYKARHLRLNRMVAVKMMLAREYAGPKEQARFVREAESLAALNHPHIVRIFEVGDRDGQPFFTMEYVDGGNLAQRLAGMPQPAHQAAALVEALAGAVQAAHASGIVHRDLKPSNILLTADGTPRITDFGLARRFEPGAGLTRTDDRVGTPSYMAPEQANPRIGAVGPGTDIYALGAILYEMLTGRPPFRAETAIETVRQLLSEEPAAPSKLNARVPRNLETICLKCLSRHPAGRYASSDLLGADLRRFLDGEPIAARPEGRLARIWRRVRRNPAYFTMLGSTLLLAASLTGVGLWLAAERAEMNRRFAAEVAANERAAEGDLRDMTRAMDRRAWPEARLALDRAEGRAGGRGSAGLREALDRGRRDLDMIDRLETIRMESVRTTGGVVDPTRTSDDFGQTFRRFGIGGPGDRPAEVAARVVASNARMALMDALDFWPAPSGSALKEWTLSVGRLGAGEGSGWVADARDPNVRRSPSALRGLIASTPFADQPVTLLLAIADDFAATGNDAIPFRMRVQHAWPGDFWANFALGLALGSAGRHAEAVRYLQAALAIRPDAAISYQHLGFCLASSGHPKEAIEYNRAALRLDPTAVLTSFNLAIDLRETGQLDEAIELLRSTLGHNPGSAMLHYGLGEALASASRDVEALAEYRRAAEISPTFEGIHQGITKTLIGLGRGEEARAAWRAAIDARSGGLPAADGYAEFCLFLRRTDEYRAARRDLLRQSDALVDPRNAERAGRACLLLADSPEDTARAAALIDRALSNSSSPAPAWTRPYFLVAKGLAEYRLGRFRNAIDILQGEAAQALGPCPRLITAMAQERLGLTEAARESLATAVGSYDWDETRAQDREHWIYHILRREAEATVRGQPSAEPGDARGE